MKTRGAIKYCFHQKADDVHEIYLYDNVTKFGEFNWETWSREESETSAAHFAELLSKIPDTAKIVMYFNSNGGEVDQGTAIYNLLQRHKAHKTGIVDGVCNSIAFTIFQAMDHRIMGYGTSGIIHNMWCSCCGNSDELRKCADNLDVFMESCIQLFMKRAKGVSEDELRQMFKNETVLTPEMALQYGFCDEVGQKKDEEDNPQEVLALLQKENLELKQKIKSGNEASRQLTEFYKGIMQNTKPKVEQSSGWGAFFSGGKKNED